jgi:hypothetical protein
VQPLRGTSDGQTLAQVIRRVAEQLELTEAEVCSGQRLVSLHVARAVVAYLAVRRAGLAVGEVAAALADAQVVNYSTIARDCGVSHTTLREHFQILVDTLLGRFLPAYARRPKRRVSHAPKFYFHDVGVVNVLAKRGRIQAGSALFGQAFENWVFHELTA